MRLLELLENRRTLPNPLPHIKSDDDNFLVAYDRADNVIFPYMKKTGLDRRSAQEKLSVKTEIPIDQLIGTESHLDPRGSMTSRLPSIYKVDGKYYIGDGNHRVYDAYKKGAETIPVFLLDIDNLELTGANSRLTEITQHEQDIENVINALKNAPSVDNRTALDRDEDEEDNRTFRNPLPHLTPDDPRFAEWYDRGDDVLAHYAQKKRWSIRAKGMIRAASALGQKQVVPIDQLIGTERYLDPRGLERKASAKFSSKIPVIYMVDGNMLIVDGNHRVVQSHQNGKTEVEALVIDVNALEQQFGIEV